jgi:hypothetical protein
VTLVIAFSSEVDAGSREENASKQEARAIGSDSIRTVARVVNQSLPEAGLPFPNELVAIR